VKKLLLAALFLCSNNLLAQPKLVGALNFHSPDYGGSIIRMDLPAGTPGNIHSFDNDNPHAPFGGLCVSNDDWLYGSVGFNGVNQNGGLYRIRRNGTGFTMLYNYASAPGETPYYHTDENVYVVGGRQLLKYDPVANTTTALDDDVWTRNLCIDNDDWIYYHSFSTIEKIKTDGSSQTHLYTFSSFIEGFNPLALTEVPSGKLFGLNTSGGANDGGTLYSIDKDGNNFALLHVFESSGGLTPMSRLIYFDGKLFGVTLRGGTYGYGTIYSINADGTGFRVIYHFDGGNASAMPAGKIHITSNGRIIGAFTNDYQVAFNGYKLYKIDTSGQHFEPFFSISQRNGGAISGDVFVLNDANVYFTSMEYGIHNGGVLNSTDTIGNGGAVHHFGYSATGFRPAGSPIKASDGKLYGATVNGGSTGNGIVYSVNIDGSAYTVLHEFSNSDGYEPAGKLLEASDGMLYGACRFGDSHLGSIYRMQKNGTNFQIIKTFLLDGNVPVGGLIEDQAGILYGVHLYGTTGGGGIFRMNRNGSGYLLLKEFPTSGDLMFPYNGVVLSKGYLYGLCAYGGAENKGGVFRIRTDGSGYQVLHQFTAATGGGELPVGTPLIASNGKLYGAAAYGGANNEGQLFSIDTTGTNFTVLHTFAASVDGAYPWGGLLQASDGIIYGTTTLSSITPPLNGGTVFRINLDGTGFAVIKEFNSDTEGQGIVGPLIDLNGSFSLPVRWTNFNAVKKQTVVALSWQTGEEVNNDRFEIERSADGTNFMRIGTVAATNNRGGSSYSFDDVKPLMNKNFYRLRQVDIDGKFTFSRIVTIDFAIVQKLTLLPNPVSDVLIVNAGVEAVNRIIIRDVNGRLVKHVTGNGTGTIQVPVAHLHAGLYLAEIITTKGRYTERFIKN
jgi:uncharacterized repeat protein (TIGR03803 family)